MDQKITLQSQDGVLFHVDIEAAKKSEVIKSMLEGCSTDEEVIPIPKVRGSILGKILDWCIYHKHPMLTGDCDCCTSEGQTTISSWDQSFLNVNVDTLLEIVMAANYLDIKELFQLSCLTTANIIKGRTPEEIRSVFHIENDLDDIEKEH